MRTFSAVVVCCGFAFAAFAADLPKTDRDGYSLPKNAIMRLGTLRNRAPISSFGIEKDGTIVTVGAGPVVRRWRAKDDKSAEPIPLASLEVDWLSGGPEISPDGKYVLANSKKNAYVWETPPNAKAKPKEIASFEGESAGRFLPDGSKFLIGSAGGPEISIVMPRSIYLCDSKTGKKIELEGAAEHFGPAAFSGDGNRMVSLPVGRLILWNTENGKQVVDCKFDDRGFIACALNHGGDLLVAQPYQLNKKFEWHFFDPLTGKKRSDLTGPEGGTWASFAPDGKTLLVGDHNGVQWWDPAAKKLLRRFEGDVPSIPARFSPDGKTLVATNGRMLYRWDAETGKPLLDNQNAGHAEEIYALGVSPDGKQIATHARDHRVCIWDANTGKEMWQARAYLSSSRRLCFSPDGKFLYVPGEKWDEVYKRDAATGKILQKYACDPKTKQAGIHSLRVSSDGKTVTALMGPGEIFQSPAIITWNTESGERLKTSRVFDPDSLFDLSPDAAFFVCSDGEAVVRSVANQSANHLKDSKLLSRRLGEFSDDGKWLTMIVRAPSPNDSSQYSAAVISTKTWKVVGAVPITEDGRVALSPDGTKIAVAHGERLEFYTVETGKLIDGYDIPEGDWKKVSYTFTQVLHFTPDGTKLITGHTDTTVLVWPVPKAK